MTLFIIPKRSTTPYDLGCVIHSVISHPGAKKRNAVGRFVYFVKPRGLECRVRAVAAAAHSPKLKLESPELPSHPRPDTLFSVL